MKILKLEIKYIRGIPDLKIEPKGKSFVIYGPNGSGKSAVIDALDFLLTGRIARLCGEGTEDVSLKEHGPHINKIADLSNVEVNAEIAFPGIKAAVIMSRKMSNPNELLYDPKYKTQLAPILELLNRGQYVLTRREILKLITAKSSTRLQEIQKVLRLSNLEDIRANLVAVHNESKREYKAAQDALEKGKRNVLATTGHAVYDEGEVLKFVNEQRTKLGGEEIEGLKADQLQQGITGIQVNPLSINHKNLTDRIKNISSEEIGKVCTEVVVADVALKEAIQVIKEDAQASWNAKRYVFTKDGIKLIRETGECPLCDKEWPVGELKKYLQARVVEQSARQTKLTENCSTIMEKANIVKTRIKQITELIQPVADSKIAKASVVFSQCLQHINGWNDSLTNLIKALEEPIEKYTDESFTANDVRKLYSDDTLFAELKEFEKEIKQNFPEATPEQTAWDNLTKLADRIKLVEEGKVAQDHSLMVFNRATKLSEAYIEARDEILESLYDTIKDRFVGLYREMHGNDEKSFNADFLPHGAGLNLEVDFYGKGLHPPHALHSEGHQDSMGVCLFLALSEHLNTGLIDLLILDDVVMSVDIGHRRAFCNVLVNNFPDRQFVITTHDTTWANQLKSVGLIPGKQMLNFSNWDVESGPVVHYEADMWGRIQADLDNDDVPSAAAKLRRGMEEFARFVCHNIRANPPYTIGDEGDLGDFLPAAICRYKELLGKAKAAANSWNRIEVIKELNQVDSTAKEIIERTSVEQWQVNKAVHYNEWANFSKNDFLPVVSAFRDLYEKVFSCPNGECQAVPQVTYDGAKINGVRCKCGTVNWNLTNK